MTVSYSKFIGGILLIIGTSIGGGMLALPIATASAGFGASVVFLTLCWLVMTVGSLLVLEVHQHLPAGSNVISMAKATLGLPGQALAWISYLFLLYTLLSGYIAGGSDVLGGLLTQFNFPVPHYIPPLFFTLVFSLIVYRGIRSVDYVNRGLMFGKLGVYFLLLIIISPHVLPSNLRGGQPNTITQSIMILITSFGFATLVPSLNEYFKRDIKTVRKLIVIGSFIPLICYILWNAVIMGTIEAHGENGLIQLTSSKNPITGLTQSLSHTVNNSMINAFFDVFTSVCMLTAFLTVSLGLFDFLADGFQFRKKGQQGIFTLLLTFLPPLCIVLINPGIYLGAMNYAGFSCVILLLLLPAFMAWRSRIINQNASAQPLVPGGNIGLISIMTVSLLLLFIAFQY